jgi:succinate dehydrogenase/fumarate reductase flavoprotein subunit
VRDRDVDVIVCGAGMAGLCAAVSALEAGARTLVLDVAQAPGGSMRWSGGTIWTAPSMDVMERWVPGGSRVRQRQLVDGIAPGLAWLASYGVPERSPIASPRQTGSEVDVEVLTAQLVEAIEQRGGELRMGSTLERFDPDGPAVVIATGGFSASSELRRKYLGPNADGALTRGNPYSTGGGLQLAIAAGGRATASMATVYGHTMPAPPADPPRTRWTAVTQYASQDGVLLDLNGKRFFDESRSMSDEVAASRLVGVRDARAVFVIDRPLHDDMPLPGRSPSRMQPNFRNAVEAGGPYATADTLETLTEAMRPWGVDADQALSTLREYDAAVAAGRASELAVPKRANAHRLAEPPFHALLVRPGITFTLGGIEVDDDLRVLDAADRPIPGLYAAGADAGGTYDDGYMGGLVLGLVQGRIAGRAAATWATSRMATS